MNIIDIRELPSTSGGVPTYTGTERGSGYRMDGAMNDVRNPGRNCFADPSRIGERFPGVWDHLQKHHGIGGSDEPPAQSDGKLNDLRDLFPPPGPWRYSNREIEVRIHDVPSRPAEAVG